MESWRFHESIRKNKGKRDYKRKGREQGVRKDKGEWWRRIGKITREESIEQIKKLKKAKASGENGI